MVNDSCKHVAIHRGKKRPDNVYVVRNGPSLAAIRDIVPNPDLKEGRRYLLSYVGMMGPQEGMDVLLRAIRTLTQIRPQRDFYVRIMGGGTVLDGTKRYAVDLRIDDLITFTGPVEYNEVLEGIASADVCLCPDPKTPLSDKCSLVKAIEYMSMGRPFVAFDLEEVRRAAAESALYAEANDECAFAGHIHALLETPEMRAKMGRLGSERMVNMFAWEHSIHQLYAAYDSVFGGEHRRGVIEKHEDCLPRC